MKYLNSCIVVSAIVFLASCGSSVPKCNDDIVKSLVMEIADDQIGYQLGAQLSVILAQNGIQFDANMLSTNLDAIRTINTNKQSKQVTCAANVQLLHGGKAYIEHPVTYTTQPTDDGKSVYVEARFR